MARKGEDPSRSCIFRVRAPTEAALTTQAIAMAARFLGEPSCNLFVSHVGSAQPTRYCDYRPHLGVPRKVLEWEASLTVRLLPEVVEERRKAASGPDLRRGGIRLVRPEQGGSDL